MNQDRIAHVPVVPAGTLASAPLDRASDQAVRSNRDGQFKPRMRVWESRLIFLVSLLAFAALDRRITTYLDPTTGDEPFYLMTAISIARDFDLNECNNYRERGEDALYPKFYASAKGGSAAFPAQWKGWRGAPYPLPPHPSLLVPASRQCISTDPNVPLPADGTGNELYSKHGLGLSLLVLPAFTLGGRTLVVFFLNVLSALLAVNIYQFAREATRRVWPAVLTWLAFSFTVPLLPYSFLIFPETPAALLVGYAFRRIRLWENSRWQVAAVGFSMAFLPWLHYRFTPVTASLLIYYLYQELHQRTKHRYVNLGLICGQLGVSAALLMGFFYHRYERVLPNAGDHAGSSDLAGTARGAAGLLLDQQWGLFIAAPIFILILVGLLIMLRRYQSRKDLLWLGIVFVPYFGVIANYAQWWGEWCPPARYLVATLPIFALPFALALDRIKGRAYLAIYAMLMLLSLGMTWSFLYQPQWSYHQPDGRNQTFTFGVPRLLASTPLSSQADSISKRLVDGVPSFVQPYFAYTMRGAAAGDALSAAAWRTSLPIFLFILSVVTLSLALEVRSV